MRTDLPAGTVTLLFTDVEGSTRLLHDLGADACGAPLVEHRRITRATCGPRGGVEVDTQGDSLFVAFGSASDAILAAQAITESFEWGPLQVRIGVHTGTPLLTEEGYVGEFRGGACAWRALEMDEFDLARRPLEEAWRSRGGAETTAASGSPWRTWRSQCSSSGRTSPRARPSWRAPPVGRRARRDRATPRGSPGRHLRSASAGRPRAARPPR